MADITTVMDRPASSDFTDPSIYHDRVFLVGGVKFYVYSGILSFWSEHFRRMFEGNFIEANKKEIEFKEVDADIFKKYLFILYDNQCELEEKELAPLIGISYRFLTPRVLDFCKKFIYEQPFQLFSANIELLRTVFLYDIKDLKKQMADNFMNEPAMSKCRVIDVADLAIEYNLEELKAWLVRYMSIKVNVSNLVDVLESAEKLNVPTLKNGISNRISHWNSYGYKVPKERIIEFMKLAFKYDVENLKSHLRHRIAELSRTDEPHSEKFLIKYCKEIEALPENIQDYITLSIDFNS